MYIHLVTYSSLSNCLYIDNHCARKRIFYINIQRENEEKSKNTFNINEGSPSREG